MRKITITVFGVILVILLQNCFTQKVAIAPPPPSIYVPKFDYTPPEFENKDSNKVALILLNPFYVSEKNRDKRGNSDRTNQYLALPCFIDFKDKMGIDFEESLTARGYTIKGPYYSEDEIVYTDKRNSDLLISIEIDINVNDNNITAVKTEKKGYSNGGTTSISQYGFAGTLVLDGKINIIIRAVTKTGFGDKLSVRSVAVDRKEIQLQSYYKNYPDINMYQAMRNDPGLVNPIADELERYYRVMFNKAWNYLEPAEFKEYKKLAQEIRGK